MTLPKPTVRPARAALSALTVAILLAACGSSQTTTSTAASAAQARTTSRTALAACLRRHGVTFPARGVAGGGPGAGGGLPPGAPGVAPGSPPAGGGTPGGFAGGGGDAKFRAALKACGATLPAGRRPAGFSAQLIQRYVTCVRQHGYKLPNPNLSGHGSVFPVSLRTNKKFLRASRSCQRVLATGRATPAATTASS